MKLIEEWNSRLVKSVLSEAYSVGVEEFCVCPSSCNSPFVLALEKGAKVFYWPEERSAAFFALGRSRAKERPVAIITTSGTAVGELLPAAMEAAYSGVPLLIITADRPRRYRGTGAPQTAEQAGIFDPYAAYSQDLEGEEVCDLLGWDQIGPAHINVCFDEPFVKKVCDETFHLVAKPKKGIIIGNPHLLDQFLQKVKRPLVVVSTLDRADRPVVAEFLLKLNAPVYLEAISGLREERRLQSLRLTKPQLDEFDGVLRIGGVPTLRLWRDLEAEEGKLEVLSLTPLSFSGLSWGACLTTSLAPFLETYTLKVCFDADVSVDRLMHMQRISQYLENPLSEPALLYHLSQMIPEGSLVYLGNSLPIRHWDLAAGLRQFEIFASRGMNGIDGQISTFLGLCDETKENWAVIGDLTALYDLAAPWILPQMAAKKIGLVVVNNGGGQIFKNMYPSPSFLNSHHLSFEGIAQFWKMNYERWDQIPNEYTLQAPTLIELIPCKEG
jgi:2-succinyl-5-enolpyruvyl-6-hydroxy-3-cyclohexene-1-carboxylate synthase